MTWSAVRDFVLNNDEFGTKNAGFCTKRGWILHNICEELERREGIGKREARLFFDRNRIVVRASNLDAKGGDEVMLNPNPPPNGATLEECGIVTGSCVKLLQLWSIKVREKGTRGARGLYDLQVVERHWNVQSVKLLASDVSGITSSTMRLTSP